MCISCVLHLTWPIEQGSQNEYTDSKFLNFFFFSSCWVGTSLSSDSRLFFPAVNQQKGHITAILAALWLRQSLTPPYFFFCDQDVENIYS